MSQNEDDLTFEDDEQDESGQDKTNWRDEFFKLRKKADRDIERAKKAARDEALAEVQRKQDVLTHVTSFGLKPAAADFFLKANPEAEVTPENVKTFFEELGATLKEAEEPERKEEPVPAQQFREKGPATEPTSERMSARDIYNKVKAGEMSQEEAAEVIRRGQMVRSQPA